MGPPWLQQNLRALLFQKLPNAKELTRAYGKAKLRVTPGVRQTLPVIVNVRMIRGILYDVHNNRVATKDYFEACYKRKMPAVSVRRGACVTQAAKTIIN